MAHGWRWLVAVVFGLVVVVVAPVGRAQEGVAGEAVARVVADFAGKAGYPGVAVAVTQRDRVLYARGYGRDSAGGVVSEGTPMPVASVSKAFTALAVLQLVEAGRVRLDDPVRQHLPEFRLADARGARITVRQLLNQTSGITDQTLREKSLPQPESLAEAVVRARQAKLSAEPGAEHAYTNTNFHLAARLVEVSAGVPFAEYLRDRIFRPLGMRDTLSIDQTPRDLPPQVRQGHLYAYGASIARAEPLRFVGGSDGIITTAADLARWLIMQNSGGLAPDGHRLLSAENLALMHEASDPSRSYGLGWQRDSAGRVRHSGVWFTFTASQLLLPGGYGIAVLGNSGIGLGNEGTDQLADALARLVTGGAPGSFPPMRPIVDALLVVGTVVCGAFGIRAVRRARRWANARSGKPLWRTVLRLALQLLPLALLIPLPDLLGLVFGGGRDLTFEQLTYFSFPLVVCLAVAVVANAGVLGARVAAFSRPAPTTGLSRGEA
ncbi:serine hydrolase domain-containing protein [Nocardia sp. NPDC048505]|uniref:serine hydrolase domain-containing protein n=1 Tax=Nocardia sp. NPDC048505 TaxID=3155756 RepID=UPI0033EFE497